MNENARGRSRRAGTTSSGNIIYQIKPSMADRRVVRFNSCNYIVQPPVGWRDSPLVVFLPGTGGRPAGLSVLLNVVASQGCPVIGLEYVNRPAVMQVCASKLDANCTARIRHTRIFGGTNSKVQSSSIICRLQSLLRHLSRITGDKTWARYIRNGDLDWSRIVVAGASQGAGMAAYIAKFRSVRRVVLFSGPWDFAPSSGAMAPWIKEESLTPPERWYGAFHRREKTAARIRKTYKALGIPAPNVFAFDLDPPEKLKKHKNPFHVSIVRHPGYIDLWRRMFCGSTESSSRKAARSSSAKRRKK